MPYWAHLRLGRLNGPKFCCVRGRFRRQSVRLAGARCNFHPWTATPHGRLEPLTAPIRKSQTGYLHGHVFKRICPFFPEFRHFIVSARGKLGLELESAEFSATFWRLVTCAHGRRAMVR